VFVYFAELRRGGLLPLGLAYAVIQVAVAAGGGTTSFSEF
jgi:hypothetical protein